MDKAREALLNEYAKSITGFQNMSQKAFVSFAEQSLRNIDNPLEIVIDPETGENKTRLFIYMRQAWPIFAQSFAGQAVALGESQYNLRRTQAEALRGKSLGDAPSISEELVKSALSGLPTFWEASGQIAKSARRGESMASASSAFVNSLANATRIVSKGLSGADSAAKTSVVYAQSSACIYCKRVAAGFQRSAQRGAISNITEVSFHKACNCVVDSTYVGERAFIQPFVKDVEKLEDDAINKIDAGEVEDRVLQVGSDEWFTSTKESVFAEMRNSDHFKRMNTADRQRFDEVLHSSVTGAITEEDENWLIDRTGYDSFELMTPVHKSIKSTTEKNVLSVMRSLQ